MQFVATGTADAVHHMSEGTTPKMGVDRWWAPYAAPDLDGDGIDEIAVAHTYPGKEWAIQLWLYGSALGTVEPLWACGDGCKDPWNTALGHGREESGTALLSGLYCGSVPAVPNAGSGLVFWQISFSIPTREYVTMYRLKNGIVTGEDLGTVSVSGPDKYPPTGEESLCGSGTHQPPEA